MDQMKGRASFHPQAEYQIRIGCRFERRSRCTRWQLRVYRSSARTRGPVRGKRSFWTDLNTSKASFCRVNNINTFSSSSERLSLSSSQSHP